MIVAAAKIVLDFWGNEELRDKKKLIRTLSEKVHEKYGFFLHEVDDFENLEACGLGFCFCSSEISAARKKMIEILAFVDRTSAARVVSEDYDLLKFD